MSDGKQEALSVDTAFVSASKDPVESPQAAEFLVPLDFNVHQEYTEQTEQTRESILERIEAQLSEATLSAPRKANIVPRTVFDPRDHRLKQDVLQLIVGYLQSEGYNASMLTICDEASVKLNEHVSRSARLKRLKQAILDGDWMECEKLCTRQTFKNYRSLLFAVYKQQYLELIDKGEFQKAFSHLTKRLKPLESMKSHAQEFADLCYLLSCRSISESPAFRSWDGVIASRERLAEFVQEILNVETAAATSASLGVSLQGYASSFSALSSPNTTSASSAGPPRLIELIQQAVAYQIEFSRYAPKANPKLNTLMEDYQSLILPNRCLASFRSKNLVSSSSSVGVESKPALPSTDSRSTSSTPAPSLLPSPAELSIDAGLKCISFVGEEGDLLVSGGSEQVLRFWSVELAWLRQQAVQTVGNHDVPDAESAHQSLKAACKPASAFPSTLAHIAPSVSHSSRIWDVGSSPDGSMVISAAGDGCLRLFDVRTAREASQRRVAHMRECIDSDSGQWDAADGWDSVVPLAHRSHFCDLQSADASSGPCDMYATTFHPGGRHIVGAGFDRKVRVWDVETGTCLHTLSGHVGAVTSVAFSPLGHLLFTGGKEGSIRVWDLLSGISLKSLTAHLAEVTSLQVDARGSMLLSSSKDNSNRLWDIRMGFSKQKFKGHLNTSKNFISSCFGSNQELIAGGSEDGKVYLWDTNSGHLLTRLSGHSSVVFDVQWHAKQSLLASCSADACVKLWWFDPLHKFF